MSQFHMKNEVKTLTKMKKVPQLRYRVNEDVAEDEVEQEKEEEEEEEMMRVEDEGKGKKFTHTASTT